MQTTLSLRDIILARVPCSSSSFLSANSRTDSHEGEDNVPGSFRKRRRGSSQVVCQLKKQNVESELLEVSRDSWLLVGLLQLWNKSSSAHPQACSNTLDCLALTDGATTVCCTVIDVDPQLLGQLVQVTSWTFVPWASHRIVEAGVPLEFLGNTDRAKSARKLTGDGHVIGSESIASPGYGGGILEIRSLKLLAEASAHPGQAPTFPSLCLSPATADIRNQVLESPSVTTGPSKPRLRLWGSLQCISPPFVLPSKRSQRNLPTPLAGATTACNGPQKSLFRDESGTRGQSEGQSMLGFLVELQTCPHTPHCNYFCVANKVEQQPLSMSTSEEAGNSNKEESSRVYFTGSVAAWRPVLGGMLGECVVITGLRSKMICVGPERKEYSVFVATRTSLVFHLGASEFSVTSEKAGKLQCSKYNLYREQLISRPREDDTLGRKRLKGLRRQRGAMVALCGEAACQQGTGIGSYVGTVTDTMMQGQLVQLDKQVWLLMTHYNHTYVHGLRVGAMVAVKHAHIIALKSPSEKGLLLGTCFRSHIRVVLYSALNTEPVTAQASQSRLKKCIEGLPLTSAFWVLQITATLRCKLKGGRTDEEILGSNKDAFKEFFLHNPFCHLGDTSPATSTLKVPPISNFCEHVETLWLDQGSLVWHREYKKKVTSISQRLKSDLHMPRNGNRPNYVRHIISSTELGVVLIGALKVCQLSGKLQLADATGALDAVVPDLQSFSNLHCMYQISEFKMVLEGEHNSFSDCKSVKRDRTAELPISWSNLLRGVVLQKKPSKLFTYYVYFHLRQANCYQGLSWPTEGLNSQINSSVLNKCQEMQRSETCWNGRQFDIVMITHKHPVTVKEREPSRWTFYSEAILLPWYLSIQEETRDKEHTICTIDCTVCCLPPQSSVDRKSLVFAAALKRRRCLQRTGESKTCCLNLEGHRETQRVETLEKLLLEFNWRSIEYSQVINVGQYYLLPILHKEPSTPSSLNFCSTSKRVSVGTSLPVFSLDWEFLRDCQSSNANKVATSYETPSATLSGGDSKEYVEITGCHQSAKIQNLSGYGKYLNCLQFCNSAFPSLEWKRGSTCIPEFIPFLNSKFKMGSSDGSTENVNQDTVTPKIKVPQLADAVIVVSKTSKEYLKNFLAEIRAQLFITSLGVRETLEHASHPAEMSPDKSTTIAGILDSRSNAVSEETMDGIFSLQGQLVSVWGKVESMELKSSLLMGRAQHKQPCSSSRSELGKEHLMMILEIQDLHGDQILNVQFNFDKYVCPIGLGPGAVVCLLRILLQSGSSVQLQSIPATLIMIHEVEERLPLQSQGSKALNVGSPDSLLLEFDDDPDGLNRLDLLNDLIIKSEPTKDYLRVHCKVVAVQMLELEWQGSQVVRSAGRKPLPDSVEDIIKNVSITTASFLLDDGSAVAECWASYKQAAHLLGFPEPSGHTPAQSNVFCNLIHKLLRLLDRHSAEAVSLDQVLSLLVQKHGRIIVLGEPPQGDTGSTSWLIRAANGDRLQEEEALILRLFMQRACQMVSKVVQCQVLSAEQSFANSAGEVQQQQHWMTLAATNNRRPWQTLTWSRTQLVARKVECTNNWKELESLARDF